MHVATFMPTIAAMEFRTSWRRILTDFDCLKLVGAITRFNILRAVQRGLVTRA